MTSPIDAVRGARPYPWFLPQSVKVYPLHQMLPETPPPRASDWNPVMAPAVAAYLAGCGPTATVGRQLYIHIPFCPAFCHFCCLYKTMEPDQQGAGFIAAFVDTLIEEIRIYGALAVGHSRPLSSVYFGGGTPSMLTVAQFERIIGEVLRSFPRAPTLEITFEGMAHQLKDRAYLAALAAAGVTRISYGVQTFQPELRKQLGRLDTVADIVEAAQAIRETPGLESLNFELLMGVPGQSLAALLDDLSQSVEAAPQTLDVLFYNAIPGTKYYGLIRDGRRPPQAAGDDLLRMRLECIAFLESRGYHHATGEIFDSVPDRLDRFNATHYGGATGLDEMLSLGPSSYGFVNGVVYSNVASVTDYMRLVREQRLPIRASRAVTLREARRRGLLFGIQLRRIRRETVVSWIDRALVFRWERAGLLVTAPGGWELTAAGKAWYNMMQLEAMPLAEASAAIDLVFDPDERRRLLFRSGEVRGNLPLARELERLIEGPVPVIGAARRAAYHVLSALPVRRPGMTFTGPIVDADD